MSRRLFVALGGVLLVSAPLAAAPPDPDGKPVGEAAAVAAATADRTLRAESLDGTIVNTIYLDADGSLRIIRAADGGTTGAIGSPATTWSASTGSHAAANAGRSTGSRATTIRSSSPATAARASA